MAKMFSLFLGTVIQQEFGSGEEHLKKSEEKHCLGHTEGNGVFSFCGLGAAASRTV